MTFYFIFLQQFCISWFREASDRRCLFGGGRKVYMRIYMTPAWAIKVLNGGRGEQVSVTLLHFLG